MTVPSAEAYAALERELAESRAYQAASEEVLRLIGESPGNLQQVFETIVERALVLCDAIAATAARYDGESLHLMATTISGPDAQVLDSERARRFSDETGRNESACPRSTAAQCGADTRL